MLYRVYAKCVTRPVGKRIEKVENVNDDIQGLINYYLNTYDFSEMTENQVSDLIEMMWKNTCDFLENEKYLGCGDYVIIDCDFSDIEIPDICGFENIIGEYRIQYIVK